MGWNPIQSGGKTADEIADLVHGTQEKLIKRGALTNLMTDRTDFIGYSQLLKRKEVAFSGGIDWRFDIIVDHNHTARHTKLYDTEAYAKEELRAELASAFLSMELGLPAHNENTAAYLQYWVKSLKDDKMEIFKASNDARKIADFVMGFLPANFRGFYY